ncbi:MAG: DUF5011 domain-containing protein [Bacteroidales bacterium]|nr:DUF5011 domain-containing protein [Bacteroidales bacterium]MBN2819708.1 DUF5011 domain-containing protein [Bacteroidales bacterium]
MKRGIIAYCQFSYPERIISGLIIFAIILLFSACEEWNHTEGVSHVSQLPKFELYGGEFVSYIVQDSGEYVDPGAVAFDGDKELSVITFGEVDLTVVGVYLIYYYSENSDGLYALGKRIVSVTHAEISENDLSGKYEGTLWSPLAEMTVTKINEKGLYKCSEVFGYPGSEMKGMFVDIGNHELVLLPGEGDFGNYSASSGEYTLSSLVWTVRLIDEPYTGNNINVSWSKIFE